MKKPPTAPTPNLPRTRPRAAKVTGSRSQERARRLGWRRVEKWRAARLTTLVDLTHTNFIRGLLMKHTIEELKFASTVREIAIELRAAKEREEPRLHLDTEERVSAHAVWQENHPLSDFIKPALLALDTTADIIAEALKV